MAFEHRDMSGSVFVNERKRPGSNQPDRNGTAKIDGVDYRVSGWLKDGKKGTFLSMSFERMDDDSYKKSDPGDNKSHDDIGDAF